MPKLFKYCRNSFKTAAHIKRINMEKTPRYTQRERNMVLGFAAQYKDVIENKRTDAESNRKKDEVWRVIAKEFNCRVYHQRSAKQLRQLYKNMKLLLKKDLCNDSNKNSKSFMDILEALSQQESINQYLSSAGSPSGFNGRQPSKMEFDGDTKMMSGGFDSDVIVIKAEDISDNDQSSSVHNGDMDDDDDDDCLSNNKDIPEVCLEEEDEELFSRPPAQSTPDLMLRTGRQPNNNHFRGNNNASSSPSIRLPGASATASNKNEFLLNLAIEERKRKIDLLNAQIEYWKTLTRKLEVTGQSSCPCHIPKMNGHLGQS